MPSNSVSEAMLQITKASQALAQLRAPCRWLFHAGPVDNPHDPNLDLSGWSSLAEAPTSPAGEAWLRSVISIPASAQGLALAGSEIGLFLHGLLPTKCYVDGRLVLEERFWAASGPALLPMAQVGEEGSSYVIAVQTVVGESGRPGGLHCAPVIRVVAQTLDELAAMRAQLQIAWELAESDAQRQMVERAAALIDAGALRDQDWAAAIASFRATEEALLPLSPLAKAHTVHLIGHAHIDMNWLWDWQDTVDVVRRDMRSVLSILRDYPEATFSHSQVSTYEIMQQHEPELFEELKQRIAEGRWEVTAATWVEGDLNMAAGESLARHFLYAIPWCQQVLGATPQVMWEPDTFGHPATIAQLARQVGVANYFHMRCNPGGSDRLPAYWWRGADGTTLFVASEPYNGTIDAAAVASAMLVHRRTLGARHSFHFHGVGDHGGGPARADLDRMRWLQTRPLLPALLCSTMASYAAAAKAEGASLPVVEGELNTIFEGCYTTHADIKQQNREGENRLLTAEALGVVSGTAHQGNLARAWQKVLFNQFHDILDGSGIPATYEQSARDAAAVKATAQAGIDRGMEVITASLDTGGEGYPIVVANALAWPRKDVARLQVPPGVRAAIGEFPVLRDGAGSITPGQWLEDELVFVARLPGLGATVYHLLPGTEQPVPAPKSEQEGIVVETPAFRAVVLKESGIIGSFVDKRRGGSRELVAYGLNNPMTHVPSSRPELALNVFQVLDERPHQMSGWLIDGIVKEESLLGGAEVAVEAHGPVCTVIGVQHSIRGSRIRQQIVFYQELERVDFPTVVDWHEVGDSTVGVPNLKVAFTADIARAEATYEVPYGAVARAANGQEQPSLRWADISGDGCGFSILNNSKYGYDALGSRLRLTLVRSPYNPDPRPDIGRHQFDYSIYPHQGDWRQAATVRRAAEFNQPLEARLASAHPGAAPKLFLTMNGDPAIVVSACKAAEDGQGIVVRCYDAHGTGGAATLAVPPGTLGAQWVNLLEQALAPCTVHDGQVEVALGPGEVRSLRLLVG